MTLDEARLMANVNARAARLYEDGYRARWRGKDVLGVYAPRGACYPVDTAAGTCGCPFFRAHEGRLPCKHLLGWGALLAAQRARRRILTLMLAALLRTWASLDDGAPPDDEPPVDDEAPADDFPSNGACHGAGEEVVPDEEVAAHG